MAQLSQGLGLSGNAVLVAVMPESSFFKKCPESQGSGVFGTRSSRQLRAFAASHVNRAGKKLYCHTDRASFGHDTRNR